MSMYTQHYPYTSATVQEFDPSLGRHDDFLLQGPYIYAQKTNSNGVISLYTSYRRGKFKKANIPSAQPHQVSSCLPQTSPCGNTLSCLPQTSPCGNLYHVSLKLKSVRVHFASGSKGRSFPLEYS